MSKTFYDSTMSALEHYIERQHNGVVRRASLALGFPETSNVMATWIAGNKKPRLEAIGPVMDIIGVRVVEPDEKLADYSLVPKTTAKAGAGSSYIVEDENDGLYAFRTDFLGRMNISEKNAVLLDVMGDSMEPTLKNGDTILIDRADIKLADGNIYLVGFQQQLLVKRIFHSVTGIVLKSDNPVYADTPIPKEYLDDFVVFGRMRWMARAF